MQGPVGSPSPPTVAVLALTRFSSGLLWLHQWGCAVQMEHLTWDGL